MSKQVTCSKKLNGGFLHERTVVFSLFFLLILFSFDWFFEKLPLSGYGLILITLVLITITTCATCQGIKWAITSNKPLSSYSVDRKSQNEKWVKLYKEFDEDFFRKVVKDCEKCFTSFQYPTHLNEQVRLLLKDIEREFVKTWYSDISPNPAFLFESHSILEEFCHKIIKKLRKCNYKNLLLGILILYLNSLQEYKKSMKKLTRLNSDDSNESKVDLSDICRYFHPGSQNDCILNYYLKKITKVVFKEFTSFEFSNSLECKILSGIIGRKVIKKLLITLEDPTWINMKLIYLLNAQKHEELFQGKVYTVQEKILAEEKEEFDFKKPTLLGKRYVSSNLFENGKSFFEKNGSNGNGSSKGCEGSNGVNSFNSKIVDKELLTLPLSTDKIEESKGNISTVLSGLISSTAGPLLPDNISVHYKALNKMWQSPVAEVKDLAEAINFKKVFTVGMRDKKGMGRSKSTDSLPLPSEPSLQIKNSIGEELCKSTDRLPLPPEPEMKINSISIGEEINESIELASSADSAETVLLPKKGVKKLTKTRSFDKESFSVEEPEETREEKEEKENTCIVPDENKKPSSPPYQRDVSPVYEEPEDFATTIAKLRSLLQQRESSSTLSDKSNSSVDSQSADKSSNKSQSLEDPFESQPTCELTSDGRFFLNVVIPKGELVTESGSTHVAYTIQYDGIYALKGEQNSEPKLVRRTTIVKRKFQDFLQLEMKLEESEEFKSAMKGLKGPSKWLNLQPGGKSDEIISRKGMLEAFLRQVCSKVEFSSSPDLHKFMGYGQTVGNASAKKDSESSSLRIDKLLANKVTGVFNSIKTVLPSFDFDSPAFITTNDGVKGVTEQKLLQGFLNFGNKSELFEINLNFIAEEQTGESLMSDIRHFLSQKSDCIEDAVDALSSSDWLAEQRECRFVTSEENCVWENFKEVLIDDDLEPLDSAFPTFRILVDIMTELLQDSDCWVIKEPVIRLMKVAFGHWETRLEEEMSKWDWDRIVGNLIRLLRVAVFSSSSQGDAEVTAESTKIALKEVILDLMPGWVYHFVKPDGLSSAVSLFVDSLQHVRLNRDVLLRLLDIIFVHLLSCHHLAVDCTKETKSSSTNSDN